MTMMILMSRVVSIHVSIMSQCDFDKGPDGAESLESRDGEG